LILPKFNRYINVLSIVLATLATLALAHVVLAQDEEPPHIGAWTLSASTGGVMGSGSYTITGSLAQPATSLAVAPSGYNVAGVWTPHPITPYPYIYGLPDLEEQLAVGGVGLDMEWIAKIPMPYPPEWFPANISYPSWPSLDALDLPDSLNLPDPPTVTVAALISSSVDVVPIVSDTLGLYGDLRDESGAIPDVIADAAGLDITGWEEGADVDFDIEMGGTSISQIATDMVEGGATVMSYMRATYQIDVIGPTVVVLVSGVIWIQFVLVIRWVLMAIILVIRIVVRLWELLPFT
jgi:hypothetical protein